MLLEGVAVGWLDLGAGSIVVLTILLILTDKLWTAPRAKATIAAVEKNAQDAIERLEKQLAEAVQTTRESHEIARIQAESIRDLTESVEQLADGQEVAVNLIRSALPSPIRRGA